MANNFVHLHVHSEYSLLDGLSKISRSTGSNNLILRAKELEMPAIALTDHGVMYGAIEFYKECKKEGLKPLIGMEGYVVNRNHREKVGKAENFHILLLAQSREGYCNLMKLSSIAHLEGFYHRPRFDKDTLKKYSRGLICCSGCPKSELGQLLISGNYQQARELAQWYADVFGPNRYYLEIQRHFYKDYFDKLTDQPRILEKMQELQKNEDVWVNGVISISRELGIPLVATNDVHYIHQKDAIAQDALVCISTGKQVSDIDRIRYVDTPTFYLKTQQEMAESFADYPDSLLNTLKVSDLCDLTLELGKWHFPNINLPEKETAADYLKKQARARVSHRYPNPSKEITDRLEYELEVICSKGYAPYFLMLADMVNWCTDRGIITNTRGSAAGSIVSYIMGITSIDPFRFGLPFERFLNPYRPSPPDIDLDIADDRREELISYVTQKYGVDKVAQICTFGRMLARAAVRDIARVLGYPYSFGDRIAKVIPFGSQGFPMTIDRALSESPELKSLYDTDPAVKKTVDLAREIEGNARHVSVHAAGIVVSPTEMTDYTPLQLEPSGTKIITQYEFHSCEDIGLVKFDILGIRNLSILGAARDIVEKTRGLKVDLTQIPLDDKKTFSMLSRGETMGTFQLGGTGMTKWLRELKPNRIEDIMIMIAMFRPGPMANIPEFIGRKNKTRPVSYIHPKMAKFLDKSFGILVYQEDIMFTALELAGYTWETVDSLRKAIGKKLPKEMAQQHEIFVQGCIKHSGMTKEEAEQIWELFVPFQGYGFNKAHAASYAVVSYQTAYMKANYPVEFMTALLTAVSENTEKIVEAVEECRRMGITVLPPDINFSDTGFTIESKKTSLDGRAIRFGLSAIKNVGAVAIDTILTARKSAPFNSLTDFCLRVDSQKVNRKVLESLIKAGCMDRFGKRSAMLASLDKTRETGLTISKLKSQGQFSLFGQDDKNDTTDRFPDIPEFEKQQKLLFEKELLGFYLTEHPHSEQIAELHSSGLITHRISELYSEDMSEKSVTIGGVVESCRNVITKSGNKPMCFAKITDFIKSVEVVVFPKVYSATQFLWQIDNVVVIKGLVESRGLSEIEAENEAEAKPELVVIAESAAAFAGTKTHLPDVSKSSRPEQTQLSPRAVILIPRGLPQAKLVALNNLLQKNKGSTPAELIFENNSGQKTLPLPYGLEWNQNLQSQVNLLLNSSV